MIDKLVKFIILICALSARIFAELNSPYSLQSAVDALHRRELQLALKDNYNRPAQRYYPSGDEDYLDGTEPESFDPSTRMNQHKLNKLLAKYLEREDEIERSSANGYDGEFDDDNYYLDERKRSFFRERDEKYDPSYSGAIFREKDLPLNSQQELTEEFLREIEQQREFEREEKYKEALRHLWEKYQQQENEIKDELYAEEKKRFPVPPNEAAGSYYIGPLMQRKRSYPVLPWLPYTAKKRFPVAKRSPVQMPIYPFSASGTDKRVAKDLQELFGPESVDDKQKRSTSDQPPTAVETPFIQTTIGKPNEIDDKQNQTEHNISHHGNHHHHHGPTVKRSDSNEHEDNSEEHDDDHDHEHDHAHEHDEDEDEEHSNEDNDDRKKKRSVERKTSIVPTTSKTKSNLEVVKEDQIIPGDLTNFRRKKSVDWSKYFGLDRRKKSNWQSFNRNLAEIKKRSSTPDFRGDKPKKRTTLSPEKLEQMDDKLKTIEDTIIDDTIKYTGAHEGITNPEEIHDLKEHVISRLVTAYSLEKMRRNLNKLRQDVENANHLERNEIDTNDIKEKQAAAKRISVKKEKVDFDNNHHNIETSEKSTELPTNSVNQNTDDKRAKKRNGGGNIRYSETPNDIGDFEEEIGAGHFEPHNDVYLGRQTNGPLANQCPIIESMSERCRGVDLLSGDIHQDLLPICGIHQLCYLCGTSQVACDLQYLSDADSVCGHNGECQSTARSVLMILRGSPGPQLGPKECLKNPCLYRVMREIGL